MESAALQTDTWSNSALITTLGLIEGEILNFIEAQGAATLAHVLQEIQWPAQSVVMAVGALLRQGLLYGVTQDRELVLNVVPESS